MTTKRKRRDQDEKDAAASLTTPKQPKYRAQPPRGTLSAEEHAFRSLLVSSSPSAVPPAYRSVFSCIINGGDDDASASALRLKKDARLPPNIRTSDLPLRLFYQQRRCNAKGAAAAEVAVESPAELAIRIADAFQTALSTSPEPQSVAEPSSAIIITRVSTVSSDQTALGVPLDRLIVQLREIARVNPTQSHPVESPASPTHTTDQALRWLYRDDAVGVIDKPAGVLSVDGNDPQLGPSIHRRVRALCPDVRMVHRLDLETSGLLVVALTKSAAQHLNKQFRDRTVSKTYFARVVGRVTWPKTQHRRLRLPMERDPGHKLLQRIVTGREVSADSALWSVTDVKVVAASDESTLVELTPETGKTHQLRVHMLHVGHPILGDSLYAPDRVHALAPRLCLHASRLCFTHPDSGEPLEFESACPF